MMTDYTESGLIMEAIRELEYLLEIETAGHHDTMELINHTRSGSILHSDLLTSLQESGRLIIEIEGSIESLYSQLYESGEL